MTRDDIIAMAREAEVEPMLYDGKWAVKNLERFAALVIAAERERIIAANAPEIEKVNAHIKALEDAVAAEREACAKVADAELGNTSTLLSLPQKSSAAWNIAAAIRARGNT